MVFAPQGINFEFPICRVRSNPLADVTWKRIFWKFPKLRSIVNGSSLKISNIQFRDEGFYICEAQNFLGKFILFSNEAVSNRALNPKMGFFRNCNPPVEDINENFQRVKVVGVPGGKQKIKGVNAKKWKILGDHGKFDRKSRGVSFKRIDILNRGIRLFLEKPNTYFCPRLISLKSILSILTNIYILLTKFRLLWQTHYDPPPHDLLKNELESVKWVRVERSEAEKVKGKICIIYHQFSLYI